MARALQLAKKGTYTTHPNPRVGCVIVKNGKIIGEGYHKRAGEPHAEINALSDAKYNATASLQGATTYVTLEPCSHTGKTPPCANALIKAGMGRVVVAMQDPNPQVAGQGMQRLREAGIEVETGVLEEQARALNPGFVKRMEKGLPWVRVKLAMSLDGRTAMASGESQWITGSAARADVQRLRASADVIMTGSGTVLTDDPSLDVRISADELGIDGEVLQPLRVVLDSDLRMSPNAKMLKLAGKTQVYTCADDSPGKKAKINDLQQSGADIVTTDSDNIMKVNLESVLQDLARQQTNEVHVEAGATLCGALVQQGFVDEMVIYMAPTIMGSNSRALLNLPGLDQMKHKIDFKIKDIRAVGDDWRIQAIPG